MHRFLPILILAAAALAGCAPTTGVRFDAEVAFPGSSAAPALQEHCGGRGEAACTLDQQLTRLVPACEPGLEELYLPLGSCFPAEHLVRTTVHPWSGADVTQGRRSVFLVHGMTGGVVSFSPSAGHLAAALRASGHKVFSVDYNADGDIPRALVLYELRDDEWQPVGLYGMPLSGTTLTITDVAASLRDAIRSTAAAANVAIVGHSMGGLVARTLVQNHYGELRLAGTRVAEVITLGSPHTGGGFGIPEITTGRGVQGITMCWGLRAISNPQLRRFSYQACIMERWHEQREALPPGQFIDNRDFPEVRWLAVAGGGQTILNRSVHAAYQEIQGWLNASFALNLDLAIAEVDSDSMVAVSSAFGIQVDGCFPHRHDEPDAGLVPLVPDGDSTAARLRRTVRTVNGQPLYSAECFLPSPGDAGGRRYQHLAPLDGTDHQYEGREEVITFVDAMLAPARRP